MKNKKTATIFLIGLLILMPGLIYAQEALSSKENIWKIERARWSGLSIFELRIFGNWRPIQRGSSFLGFYLGSTTPYFELNESDKEVFRGLGRDNDIAQIFFPTLVPNTKLKNILETTAKSRESLQKYEQQIKNSEMFYTISRFTRVGGEYVFFGGMTLATILIFAGPEAKNAFTAFYIIGEIGGMSWIFGIMGEFVSNLLLEESFGFLDDAVDYFNDAHNNAKKTSFNSYSRPAASLAVAVENGKITPSINFAF